MSKTWFVTGTDTEVGKTAISCALLAAARGRPEHRGSQAGGRGLR